jgi:hypothetical protein
MRSIRLSLIALLTFAASLAFAQQKAPGITLPKAFGGWVQSGASQPTAATPQFQAVMKEFRLEKQASAHYDQYGRTLDLTVYRFPDYTGAYGSFTMLREPNMLEQQIGDGAASGDNRVIFFRGNILADARFSAVNAMTLSQLRELSRILPVAAAPGNPPALPNYLPKQGLIAGSTKYAIGPDGLAQTGAPLNAAQLRFDLSPEVVTGRYQSGEGVGTVTIVSYPTPQIAGDILKQVQPGFVQANTPANQIKRTHSMLVLSSGQFSEQEAKSLLASVNYDADLTWNQATKPNPRDNVMGLLANVIILSGILVGFMFIFGIFFGGFRLLYYKLYPAKAAAHEESQELIRLNLR